MIKKLRHCPFCGAVIRKRIGFGGIQFYECTDKKNCGAIVSFDSDACAANPEKADENWNRRAGEIQLKGDTNVQHGESN